MINFSFIFIFSMLEQLSGFKKVLNYTKRVMEDVKYRKTVSREEVSFIHHFSRIFEIYVSHSCRKGLTCMGYFGSSLVLVVV